jgi:hypothetical protein
MWSPATEQEIIQGIASGAIKETHFIEVKERSRNEQVAQTLASLAIDGGQFILGIAEENSADCPKRLKPAPIPIKDWTERIDGIARNSIEPPLAVRVRVIPSNAVDGSGYIVMSVAASPLAPHMSDGRYYGRGEASKHTLSDAEVLRHHHRRQQQVNLADRLLDEAEENDYVPSHRRQCGHVYLVAEPLMPVDTTRVEEFLADENAIRSFVMAAQKECRQNLHEWAPTPMNAQIVRVRDASTSAVSRDANGPGRSPDPGNSSEHSLLDIELTDTGGLRIFLGRGVDTYGDIETPTIIDPIVVAYAQRLAFWIVRLSEIYGYQSTWTCAFRINGIAGRQPQSAQDNWGFDMRGNSMERDVFSSSCTVSTLDVRHNRESVVRPLVAKFLRVLGVADSYDLGLTKRS